MQLLFIFIKIHKTEIKYIEGEHDTLLILQVASLFTDNLLQTNLSREKVNLKSTKHPVNHKIIIYSCRLNN